MQQEVSTLTSKGQVTIPQPVRTHLGIKQGDKLSFIIRDDGSVELRVPKYPTIESLRGAAGSIGHNLTLSEMREIAYEGRFLPPGRE